MTSSSPSPSDAPASRESAQCLLCVDDHAEVLSIMGEFLRVFGYSVLTAPSGARGLQLLQRNSVDAVILDYEMPRMDGAELAAKIKRARPDLPILMFTGYPAEVSAEVRRSVDALVVKGEPADKLLQTLRGLLSAKAHPVPAKTPGRAASERSPGNGRNRGHGRRRVARSA